jgi:hypothetical protein
MGQKEFRISLLSAAIKCPRVKEMPPSKVYDHVSTLGRHEYSGTAPATLVTSEHAFLQRHASLPETFQHPDTVCLLLWPDRMLPHCPGPKCRAQSVLSSELQRAGVRSQWQALSARHQPAMFIHDSKCGVHEQHRCQMDSASNT